MKSNNHETMPDSMFGEEASASQRNAEQMNHMGHYTLTTQVTFYFSASQLAEIIDCYEREAYTELVQHCQGGVIFGSRGATLKAQPVNLITHREQDRRNWRMRKYDR